MFLMNLAAFLQLSVVFFLLTSAAPLTQLERRGTCEDNRESPCICDGAFGLRDTKVASNCPNTESFQFVDKTSGTDGKIHKITGNQGTLQCDHIIELQFIAQEIDKNPAICTRFLSNPADFKAFFTTINNQPNLAFVESTVNNAKGKLFADNILSETTSKAADGVESYMGLLKGAKINQAVKSVDGKMSKIMAAAKGTGFSNFASAYNTKVATVISEAKSQKAGLLPASSPADPFLNSDPTKEASKVKAKAEAKAKAKANGTAGKGSIQKTAAKKKPAVKNGGVKKAAPKKSKVTPAKQATAAKKVANAQKAAAKKTQVSQKKGKKT